MLTAADFDQLGFWEDATPEENITAVTLKDVRDPERVHY